MDNNKHLLDIRGLKVSFWTEKGRLTAVEDATFSIKKGETIGVVGESGCGKSVTSESILQLHDEQLTDYEGQILYKDRNLLDEPERKLRKIRGNEISMIFQDPMSSLNPVFTIGNQLVESLMLHRKPSKKAAYEKAIDVLRQTGIPSPEKRIHDYPHQLSGGMRQRVMIALAISCEPELLIADEPTTALDVTTQAQILDVLNELQEKTAMGIMMITHDLAVVAETCDRVVVMYLGQVIEETTVDQLFENALHPYTIGLLKSMPSMESDRSDQLFEIEGTVPALENIPTGCRFADRCPFATNKCLQEAPVLENATVSHKVRCWNYEEIALERGNGYATTTS
ncbi:ABC transporter ATP-binding protein [Oceanobacillus halophilus]|uniref:ABC transporter ATP-binding protein n=1 Tax=Oceanobacillus halophilus TaxID=930130 RepID=A0A494ZS36_9BACI|nr:ABC transporter ATP-binding protein [Oceanobacillus halophilus]RKQ28670.1 ABC transporter ATP-binding protein [Oceanobacillus halophilus]